ncbi:hypothetical protein AK812_SmicGene34814 [Symbiodinium microadriaticum]|uniref:Uncharacterized protein n=1 Tax=Symbiodinium microadriaticum TaxID=2951 RepID=A0A1Q9CN37_SYMMI|nr:hypothetical protein AK812_SmicGene34814 [Symbiodinium microadriaticum]
MLARNWLSKVVVKDTALAANTHLRLYFKFRKKQQQQEEEEEEDDEDDEEGEEEQQDLGLWRGLGILALQRTGLAAGAIRSKGGPAWGITGTGALDDDTGGRPRQGRRTTLAGTPDNGNLWQRLAARTTTLAATDSRLATLAWRATLTARHSQKNGLAGDPAGDGGPGKLAWWGRRTLHLAGTADTPGGDGPRRTEDDCGFWRKPFVVFLSEEQAYDPLDSGRDSLLICTRKQSLAADWRGRGTNLAGTAGGCQKERTTLAGTQRGQLRGGHGGRVWQ